MRCVLDKKSKALLEMNIAIKPQDGGMITSGSKRQVFNGTAKHTAGGLTKKDLVLNKRGRIVSKKQMAAGKKAITRLRKLGFVAKKGTFKLFKKHGKHGGAFW